MFVNVKLLDMPTTIRGFVKKVDDDDYTIVLNSRLSVNTQQMTYEHEMYHIVHRDFERFECIDVIEFEAHNQKKP